MRQLTRLEKLKVTGAATAVLAGGIGSVAVATADAPVFNCSEYVKTAVKPRDTSQMVPVLGRAMKACFDNEISEFHKNATDDDSRHLHTLSADIPLRNGSKIVFAMDSAVATTDPNFVDRASRVEVMTRDQDDKSGQSIALYTDPTFAAQWNGSNKQVDDPNQVSRVTVVTEYRTPDSPWEARVYPQQTLKYDPQQPDVIDCVKEEMFAGVKELLATDGSAASLPEMTAPPVTPDCKLY